MVVVAVVVAWFWSAYNKNLDRGEIRPNTGAETSGPPVASQPAGRKTTGGTAFNLTYEQAIKKYEGVRIQFDASCQAIPNQITVKTGANVMFDNRSGDARWISLNNVGYYINGYDFAVLRLASKTLPSNVVLDCGSAQNVGQILIQY